MVQIEKRSKRTKMNKNGLKWPKKAKKCLGEQKLANKKIDKLDKN